jgi:hypothetical protein
MRRIFASALVLLALCGSASAVELLNVTVTAAIATTTTATYQLRAPAGRVFPINMGVQCTVLYGSGGLTIDAYLQTSLDGGSTWQDVVNCHATTAALHTIWNLSSLTVNTTAVTASDGALTANTVKDGIFGNQWRVKYNSTGTYAGNTQIHIDIITNGLTAQ